ncbi:MAG: methyltransferase domain-containing protein, partial [Bacteroidota bacterium]
MANQTSSSTTKQSIIDYYDQTQFDYSVAWTGKVDKAVHFGFYDATARTHREALLNTNRVLAKWAALEGGQRVLDAGCGQGGSCFWMHQQLDVETVGIAPVASQIAVCRANAAELGLASKATFEVADFCQMPFADASFDVVWACESVCHAQKKRAFYQEAYRVLKPGGRLVLAEYLRSARPLAAKEE